MPAMVEWKVGILRWGPSLRQKGDPYDFVATLVREDGRVKISGAHGVVSPLAWREIREELYRLGISEAEFERFTTGPGRTVLVKR